MKYNDMLGKIIYKLKESGDSERFEILNVDAEIWIVELRCKDHGDFTLSYRGLLGTANRIGRRCQKCEDEAGIKRHGMRRIRTSFEEAVEQTRKLGFKPGFEDCGLDYSLGQWRWVCTQNGEHELFCSLNDIKSDGCIECKRDAMRSKTWDALKQNISHFGYEMMSLTESLEGNDWVIKLRRRSNNLMETVKLSQFIQSKLLENTPASKPSKAKTTFKVLRKISVDNGFTILSTPKDFDIANGKLKYLVPNSDRVFESNVASLKEKISRHKVFLKTIEELRSYPDSAFRRHDRAQLQKPYMRPSDAIAVA